MRATCIIIKILIILCNSWSKYVIIIEEVFLWKIILMIIIKILI